MSTRTGLPAGFVSVTEAAAYLGTHRRTIERRIAEEVLPAYLLGPTKTLRVRVDDLNAMMIRVEPNRRVEGKC